MADRERTLAAVVDGFLPAAGGLPSASDLGVHRLLLAEVEALGRPSFKRELDFLLGLLGSRLGSLAVTGRPTAFSNLGQDAREAALRRLAASTIPQKRMAFQDLKRLTMLYAYGIEDSPWRAASGYVPPALEPPRPTHLSVRTPAEGEVVDADVVVIGSGPGGGVAASVLAAAGRSVVVLERAAMVDETGFGGPELGGLGALFLDRGLSATTDRWISIRAGSAVGGGSIVNWSTSLRAPASVLEAWRLAGIEDDLDEHYEAIEADIHVTTDESPRNGPNGRLAAGLDALGLPSQVIPRAVDGCGDCGPCAVGCRIGAKQSSLRTTLAAASANGARILDRCEARRILLVGDRVAGVVAHVPEGEITVRAPMVALAGGSVLSPALLLRSGIAEQSAGRGLHLHPVAAVAAVYDESLSPWAGVPQSVMCDAFVAVDGGWGFRVEAAPTHPGLIASGLPWWGSAGHRETMARCDGVAAFIGLVRDRTEGRVSLARDGGISVAYSPIAEDRALLRRAQLELARIHRAAGARHIVPLVTPPLDWREGRPFEPWLAELGARPIEPNRVLLFSAHQMSTCRIGRSPRDSVADPDGRVHGIRGLYVTDASAMPTASCVNPMLSLMALARRTALRMVAAS